MRKTKQQLDKEKDEAEKKFLAGELISVPLKKYPTLLELYDKNENKLAYLYCTDCETCFVSGGGGNKRHVFDYCPKRKAKNSTTIEDYFSEKCLTKKQKTILDETIGKMAVKCNLSFNLLSSPSFAECIAKLASLGAPVSDCVKKEYPSRKVISDRAYKNADDVIEKYGKIIEKHLERGPISLNIDFGAISGIDFLSCFASFIDDSGNKWKLMTIPIGFTPCEVVKTSENIHIILLDLLEGIGIDEDMAKKLYVTSDGATNIKSCIEKNFAGYVYCACHSLNIFMKRLFEPYEGLKKAYDETDLIFLKTLHKDIDNCCQTVNLLRNCKKINKHLSFAPRMHVATRWASKLYVLEDVLKALPELLPHVATFPPELKRNLRMISNEEEDLAEIIKVLKPFHELITMFESETSITINRVVPCYIGLQKHFNNLYDYYEKTNNPKLMALCNSGKLLSQHNISKVLGDVHYTAYFLTPKYRKLSKLDDTTRMSCLQYVRSEIGTYDKSAIKPKITKIHKSILDGDSTDEDEDSFDEVERYTEDRIDKDISVESFWSESRNKYPLLYKLALKIFGTLPSEASCERSFSAASLIFSKNRNCLLEDNGSKLVLGKLLYTID